jgi:hypothetical protein
MTKCASSKVFQLFEKNLPESFLFALRCARAFGREEVICFARLRHDFAALARYARVGQNAKVVP